MDLTPDQRQYCATALWSSLDDNGEPLDRAFEVEDIQDLLGFLADWDTFAKHNMELIADDLEQAAHDFWLTRNGHGAGFWDGDWPEHGEELTRICEQYGTCNLIIGDDGKLYHISQM